MSLVLLCRNTNSILMQKLEQLMFMPRRIRINFEEATYILRLQCHPKCRRA